jgi:hypothetical protein
MSAVARRLRLSVVIAAACGLPGPAVFAQAQPFLFTVTTIPPKSAEERWVARYDAGYAERTAEPFGFDGVEQRVGVQGSLPRGFTLLGHVGLGVTNGARTGNSGTHTNQEIEVLKDLHDARHGVGVTVGLGLAHEWEGATVLLGRVALGHSFTSSSLFGNLRFEKPFEEGRDAIDLVSTLGWMHQVGRVFNLGVEAVGEDLEGFWEAEEAEGGAKLFVGPSVHVAPPNASWSMSLAGGPILYATRSGRTSPAARPLDATDNGYTVRASFGFSF